MTNTGCLFPAETPAMSDEAGAVALPETLAEARAAGAILGFRDEYRFLSNFWFAKVVFDGETYRTVEHAYQAAKTPVPGERSMIQAANLPAEAKRLGRGVTMRRDWDSVKLAIMADLIGQKFQNAELRRKLLATGAVPILELNSWGDRTWGVIEDKAGRLIGANHMGRILMDLRSRLAAA